MRGALIFTFAAVFAVLCGCAGREAAKTNKGPLIFLEEVEYSSIAARTTEEDAKSLQKAINTYKKYNKKWPQILRKQLVPLYIDHIPAERFTGLNKIYYIEKVKEKKHRYAEPHINGRGGWLYFTKTGEIFLNLKGKGPDGRDYFLYGH